MSVHAAEKTTMAETESPVSSDSENTPLLKPDARIVSVTYGINYSNDTAGLEALDEANATNDDQPQNNTDQPHNNTDGQGVPPRQGVRAGLGVFRRMSGRQKCIIILTTLAMFLSGVSYSMLGPFFPTEAEKKGMTVATVGFVFGVYQIVIFLTAPLFGIYLVKLGPKFVFNAGIFVAGFCNILFGVLRYCPDGSPFVYMCIIVRSVEALGFAGFITSCFAIAASEFKENVGFTLGILETGSGLGFTLGPAVGGALFELGGFGLPFYFGGTAILLNGLAVYTFLPELEQPPKRKHSVFSLLRSPMVTIPLFSVLVGGVGITTYDSTFARHLKPLHFSEGLVGIMFAVVASVYSIMSSIWGHLSDHKNIQSPLIVGGHLVFGIGFLLIGPSVFLPFLPFNLKTILPGLVCIGVSFGCALIPTLKCMVIGVMEIGFEKNVDTFALVSGLFNSMFTLAGFVGPLCIGYLVQEFDYPIAYTTVAMASFLVMIVSLVFFTIRRCRRKRTTTTVCIVTVEGVDSEDPSTPHVSEDESSDDDGTLQIPPSRVSSSSG